MKITPKIYKCKKCGCESTQSTNHKSLTWSVGHFNTCPNCPPYEKYPEFGGMTLWVFERELTDEVVQ